MAWRLFPSAWSFWRSAPEPGPDLWRVQIARDDTAPEPDSEPARWWHGAIRLALAVFLSLLSLAWMLTR